MDVRAVGRRTLAPIEITETTLAVAYNVTQKAQGYEIGYFFQRVETDETLADRAESDFRDGGLKRKKHIVWGVYGILDFLTANVKFFTTKTFTGTRDGIDRLRVDLIGYF